MSVKFGSIPVGNSQKVAEDIKRPDLRKPFTVFWNQSSANVGQQVGISGTINVPIPNTAQITVKILFNDQPYLFADEVEIKGSKITASWKVTPFKAGTFTSGIYDVEIRSGGLSGKTQTPLRIVSSLVNRDVSSFG